MRTHRIITTVSLVYLLWLLLLLFVLGYTPTNDAEGYIIYAQTSLERGEAYPSVATMIGEPFIWNIGIINLIALSLKLFNATWPILLLMCVMKAATAYLLGRVAMLLVDDKTAVIATLLYVLYPNNWGDVTMLMSEIPMICFTMWALFLLLSRNRGLPWVIAGVLLGIANWFRPVVLLFVVTIFVFYLIFQRRQLLKRMVCIFFGIGLFIGIVGSECRHRTGFFIFQADTFWFNMVDECYDGSPVAPHYGMEQYAKGTPRYIENRERLSCFECQTIWRERSLEWLRSHPVEYLSKIPGRLYYMYRNDIDNMAAFKADRSNAEQNNVQIPYRHLLSQWTTLSFAQWLSLLTVAVYYLMLAMAAAGSWQMISRRKVKEVFLPLFYVLFGTFSIVLVMHGEGRFKQPFMPFIIILAATFFNNRKVWKLRP